LFCQDFDSDSIWSTISACPYATPRFFAALFASACGAAWGQNAAASGRVTDTSGGVIANVAADLINHGEQGEVIIGRERRRCDG